MQQGASPGKGFVASASIDKGFALWSPTGCHVGEFGQQQSWDWKDSKTWKSIVGVNVATEPMLARKQMPVVQQQTLQPAEILDAVSDLLQRDDSSDATADECVYSSGDEMLPECFKEQSDDD